MKVNFSVALERALEEGVNLGLRRHYKYEDGGISETFHRSAVNEILKAIDLSLDEWFIFEDNE